jgi:hypothetical protein
MRIYNLPKNIINGIHNAKICFVFGKIAEGLEEIKFHVPMIFTTV